MPKLSQYVRSEISRKDNLDEFGGTDQTSRRRTTWSRTRTSTQTLSKPSFASEADSQVLFIWHSIVSLVYGCSFAFNFSRGSIDIMFSLQSFFFFSLSLSLSLSVSVLSFVRFDFFSLFLFCRFLSSSLNPSRKETRERETVPWLVGPCR